MQFADLDLQKVYSYADYFKWQFEERVELIKGKIFIMSPAPNPYHQELTGDIHALLHNFLRKKPCKVYTAPFDVRLPKTSKEDKQIFTVLQPDICVICDLSKIDGRGCVGAPDIIVEILSPGNSEKELKEKKNVYEEAGVKEYWVVSPWYQNFLVYTLEGDKFLPPFVKVPGDIITSTVLPEFSIDLTELFEDSEQENG